MIDEKVLLDYLSVLKDKSIDNMEKAIEKDLINAASVFRGHTVAYEHVIDFVRSLAEAQQEYDKEVKEEIRIEVDRE